MIPESSIETSGPERIVSADIEDGEVIAVLV
jgi:hypothetical protein